MFVEDESCIYDVDLTDSLYADRQYNRLSDPEWRFVISPGLVTLLQENTNGKWKFVEGVCGETNEIFLKIHFELSADAVWFKLYILRGE